MIDIPFEDLRAIGLTHSVVNQLGALQGALTDTSRLMRVVETQRDTCTLHDGEGEHLARLLPRQAKTLHAQGLAVTVGDWVLAGPIDSGADLWIAQCLPPVTQIARRANDGRRQSLASNVDTGLLVMGLDADFNPRRAERYVAMVRACGVAPVLVLTKADLAAQAESRVRELRQRLPASVPIVAVNGTNPQARVELAPWLGPGQTLVLLGASGVGKSTLTNTLAAGATQETCGVRKGDGRGRHTTTARSLHRCADGACIIDTPGLRTWRPDADEDSLAATFDDVQLLAAQCQFRNCRHEGEPGCAVRPSIGADRLSNYHKLLRDAQRVEATPLQRIEQRRKWKELGKAGSRRAREKRE